MLDGRVRRPASTRARTARGGPAGRASRRAASARPAARAARARRGRRHPYPRVPVVRRSGSPRSPSRFAGRRSSAGVVATPATCLTAEGRGHDRRHVLLAAGRIVDAVVAHVRRVSRCDLVHAERARPHRPELPRRGLGRGCQRAGALPRWLPRARRASPARGRSRCTRAARPETSIPAFDQIGKPYRYALDDVDLGRAHAQTLRDAIGSCASSSSRYA